MEKQIKYYVYLDLLMEKLYQHIHPELFGKMSIIDIIRYKYFGELNIPCDEINDDGTGQTVYHLNPDSCKYVLLTVTREQYSFLDLDYDDMSKTEFVDDKVIMEIPITESFIDNFMKNRLYYYSRGILPCSIYELIRESKYDNYILDERKEKMVIVKPFITSSFE